MNILKSILLFLLALSITFSCSSENGRSFNVVEATSSYSKIPTMDIDSISIQMGEYGLFYYPINSVSNVGGTRYYFGWNENTLSLDVVDLDKSKYLKSIFFERQGPNGIGDIKGFTAVSFDSIFFMSSQYIMHADSTGKIVNKWGINDRNQFEGFDANKHNLTTEETFNIFYDSNSNKLYAKLHYPNYSWCDPSLKYFSERFIGELDLKSLTFKELDVFYPEEYQSHFFGFRDIPAVTFDSNGFINYTFSISSNLYQYSIRTGETKVFGGTSDFTNNHAGELGIDQCRDTPEGLKHNLLNVKYFHIHHDSYRGLYYRFHSGEVPEIKNNGKYSAYNDKPLFLTIFDEDLKKISELEVDNKQGAIWSFVDKEGLHVLKPRGKENILGFNLFKFQ